MSTARYSLRQLFADLELEPPTFVLTAQPPSEDPWYMRIFAGIGAWFAAFMFLGFLAITNIITNEFGALVVGLGLCAVAIGINRTNQASTFLRQLALAISITGQALVLFGWTIIVESVIVAALGMIVLEIALFVAHRDFSQRLISTLGVITAIHVIAGDLNNWVESFNYMYLLLSVMIISFSLLMWFEAKIHEDQRWSSASPIAYGMLLFMAISSLLINFNWAEFFSRGSFFILPALVGIICLGTTIWMIINEFEYKLGFIELGCIAFGLLFIAFAGINTPAIIIALLIILLSYWRGYPVMFGFGCLALIGALSLYYYNLNISLLYKSIILFGTGMMLLAIRALVLKLNQKEAV
ncbi:MAG TPA: DUF4401 domain-containing protein [Herpetosiphon sp.]|uniref:DUF4401 domain-containing protein n=1 Tax=Herpetosiphon aurantiacus (strain ATCC 23779 / DSM 785 / 114-95) TaxID=316274 RepID=A9B1L5_HERA2|nr:DUF4401 domain-containing protein [Herpetosiphon sp.]ABX03900.1 hypothetical protein Haur_1252 [Herpetosiphon aurantiacus DSM 785]HBW50283.1 DUF4401 domain-containing protein [Herpetosiphon sp.]